MSHIECCAGRKRSGSCVGQEDRQVQQPVIQPLVFSERDYVTFATCYRNSVCRMSVCLSSVTLMRPNQPVKIFGNFFHHTIAQDSSFLIPKIVGGGRPFPPEICVQSDTPPFQTAQFRPISAHSASTVIASEKRSISTYKKSTARFPTSNK